jgi:hypothetical protein
MKKTRMLNKVIGVVFTFTTVSANAALSGRLPVTAGGTDFQAYYDDELDALWTADGNLAKHNNFNTAGINPSTGQMNWNTAQTWIANMNTAEYLNINNWRLPSMNVNGDNTIVNCASSTEEACEDNEYGHLSYYDGVTTAIPFPFTDVSNGYWSSTEALLDASKAWEFRFADQGQSAPPKTANIHAWAVRDGDISLPVNIDVLADCLNINGHGLIPVAILGTEDFDVATVDQYSLSFAGLAVRVLGNGRPQCSFDHVNGDSYLDLVCHFVDDSDAWEPVDGMATLIGALSDGQPVEQPIDGSDSICIVP